MANPAATAATFSVLLAALLSLQQQAEANVGTPAIQDANLPPVCPSILGYFQVADVNDNTSYYVCCNGRTQVRRTCRYYIDATGNYQVWYPAPYDAQTGQCKDERAAYTAGSFTSPNPNLNLVERGLYALANRLPTDEARAVCQAAAAPWTDYATGITLKMAANPDPKQAGQYQLIKNSAGRSSTGVVAINCVLLPESDQVLIWARLHMDGSWSYESGVISADPQYPRGVPEVSAVYDTTTGEYYVKRMRLTPFCTGNSHLADGRVLATGGDDFAGKDFSVGYINGLQGIRLYQKQQGGTWNNGDWYIPNSKIRNPRWYPTQRLLPDGDRTVIVGGTVKMNSSTPNHDVEIFSQKSMSSVALNKLAVLQGFGTWILFPVIYTLPYEPNPGTTALLFFNCYGGAVMHLTKDNQWSEYRGLSSAIWPTLGVCGAYSMGGTATMLMLEPDNNYDAEVVMFGGFRREKPQCECDTETSKYAHRINLSRKVIENMNTPLKWEREDMPYNRNLNDCVLLPNGQIIVLNGAKSGVIGSLRDPALDAWLYNPKAPAGQRFKTLAATNIHRYYHSTALLLPDASVLVAGSEYGSCTQYCPYATPWQFQHQAERFLPPYFFNGGRPTINWMSTKQAKYGSEVRLTYTGTVNGATIMAPGAVTHQVNMNQKAVKLVVKRVDTVNRKVYLSMPPNSYIAAPGWYMLFLMNGDTPCVKARWIQLVL